MRARSADAAGVVRADGDAGAADGAVRVDEVVLTVVVTVDGPVGLELDRDAVDVADAVGRRAVVRDVVVALAPALALIAPVTNRSGWLPMPPLPPFMKLPVTLMTFGGVSRPCRSVTGRSPAASALA